MTLKRISGRGYVRYIEVEDPPEIVPTPEEEEVVYDSTDEVETDWKEDGLPEETDEDDGQPDS